MSLPSTLHSSLAGFNGSPRADRQSAEAFLASWRKRMTELKRDSYLLLEDHHQTESLRLATDFISTITSTHQHHTRSHKRYQKFTPPNKQASDFWTITFNQPTQSYVVVRK